MKEFISKYIEQAKAQGAYGPIIRSESESSRQSHLRYKKELMDGYDKIYDEYVRMGIVSNKSNKTALAEVEKEKIKENSEPININK